MIFSIQRYIEDYFERRGLEDRDQYAVHLANLYDRHRSTSSDADFLQRMRRVRTTFYRNNRAIDRGAFDQRLLKALDGRFARKKNSRNPEYVTFPGGVAPERRRFGERPHTIGRILASFRNAVEARAIDSFWVSRRRGTLQRRPEAIAQALLAVFVKGVLGNRGVVLRELLSGVGFVDVAILLSRTLHLVELKILKGQMEGGLQLATYMATERRRRGWLLLLDARDPARRAPLPSKIDDDAGTISVIRVDVNPLAPSKKR